MLDNYTTEKLKQLHTSVPANPLLAEPMYLAGYIERLGTGTSDMVTPAKEAGLREPDFVQEEDFKAIIYRVNTDNVQKGGQGVIDYVADYVTDHVSKLVLILEKELSRDEMMTTLRLRHNPTFRENYLHPALNAGIIEMTIPDRPKSVKQKYRLTAKGKTIQQQLRRSR